MKHLFTITITITILCIVACNSDESNGGNSEQLDPKTETESEIQKGPETIKEVEKVTDPDADIEFEPSKWKIKEGRSYPYRDRMLNSLVYDDSIRKLDEPELLELLGDPERINEGHLYYRIFQNRLILLPLKTKTLVIKMTPQDSIEWMKIHE